MIIGCVRGVGEGVAVRGARLGLGVAVSVGGGDVAVIVGRAVAVDARLVVGDVGVKVAAEATFVIVASIEKVEQLESVPEMIKNRNPVPRRNRVRE